MQDEEPIASQALQDKLNIALSSATLRNEMALLTKLGYLNQPHVSAGRVPTNKAYRYYVNHINTSKQITPAEKRFMDAQFELLDRDSQRFLSGASKLFSDMFGLTTIIAPPLDKELKFVNFTVVKTGRFNLVAIGVTAQGEVHTRVIRLSDELSAQELEQLMTLVNAKLCFVCFDDIDKKYFNELNKQLSKENPVYAQFINGVLALIKLANQQNIFTTGQENLLKTANFEHNIGDILRLLADSEKIKNIITPNYQGVCVVFGDELGIKNIDNVCFVSTNFYAGSATKGTLCAVCPPTVDYEKLFIRINYFAQLLTNAITGAERK